MDIVEQLKLLKLHDSGPLGELGWKAAKEIERLRSSLDGRPMETAPKDKEILVLDTYDQFRIVQWSNELYVGSPRGWQDDEQRFVVPKCWWPLPSKETK